MVIRISSLRSLLSWGSRGGSVGAHESHKKGPQRITEELLDERALELRERLEGMLEKLPRDHPDYMKRAAK